MQTQHIGQSELETPRLAYGCMRIAGEWEPAKITPEHEARGSEFLPAAYAAGYTLCDHADIYSQGECQTIHGKMLAERPTAAKTILPVRKGWHRLP